MKNFGIYIHIPFCASKCNYCSFVSKPASVLEQKKYVDFLCTEIKNKSELFNKKICKTVYFGGGTPSLISDSLIKKILQIIKLNYNLSKNAEISIECNPCTISKQKLKKYLKYGINRISFGIQSFFDGELKILGRRHNCIQAQNAVLLAKEVGFKNISADVMIGIPNQTKDSLKGSIKKLISLGVTHISAYMLMLEQDTPLCEMVNKKALTVASDDDCVDMYNMAYKLLKQNGFTRYEISNFAKQGFECRHNINYWDMGEYVGFGVSAHSYYCGERIANSNNFSDYYNGKNIKIEKLTNKMKIEETIMLGLRQKKGVSIKKLKSLGYDILSIKSDEMNMLKNNKLVKIESGQLKITPKNFGVTNAIVLKLI